jgi:signal transduction histidine kinase
MSGVVDHNSEYLRLQRLLDAATLLHSTLELREITEIILNIVRDQVLVERVTAFRADRKRGVLRSLVAQDVPLEIVVPVGSGISGTAAEKGEILDISDAYADPRFIPTFDRMLNFKTRDLLALPIFNRQGEVAGVLELMNRKRAITPADLEFLQQVSIYIGLALENASLYQEAVDQEKMERELVRLRDRLAQLERLATMGQVLSGVLHQINNPLAIAVGYTGLLKSKLESDVTALQHIRKIETAVERAADVARKFMYLAETDSGKYERLEAGEVLRSVVGLRGPEWEALGIQAMLDIETAPVFGDARQLQVLFMHLLINAEEACGGRDIAGRIGVRLRHDTIGQKVRIEIEDNGPGIPPQTQEHIFDPFFTTKAAGAGTGLGLTVVRAIARRHDGRVSFETAAGRGTTFTIEFPEFSVGAVGALHKNSI